jgi:hypothetical protein
MKERMSALEEQIRELKSQGVAQGRRQQHEPDKGASGNSRTSTPSGPSPGPGGITTERGSSHVLAATAASPTPPDKLPLNEPLPRPYPVPPLHPHTQYQQAQQVIELFPGFSAPPVALPTPSWSWESSSIPGTTFEHPEPGKSTGVRPYTWLDSR